MMDALLTLRAAEKLLALGGGILSLYLGYSLFIKGVSGKASLKAQHDKSTLQLLNAAPGIFFALFGMVVLGLSVWRQTNIFVAEPLPIPHEARAALLEPLSGAAAEADAIRRVLEGAGFKVGPAVGSDDSAPLVEGLKEGRYRIIHIATHGYLVEKPEQPTANQNR